VHPTTTDQRSHPPTTLRRRAKLKPTIHNAGSDISRNRLISSGEQPSPLELDPGFGGLMTLIRGCSGTRPHSARHSRNEVSQPNNRFINCAGKFEARPAPMYSSAAPESG